MNLQEMTIEQLKSLCYDQIILAQQTQNNINIIQQEIQKRQDDVPKSEKGD